MCIHTASPASSQRWAWTHSLTHSPEIGFAEMIFTESSPVCAMSTACSAVNGVLVSSPMQIVYAKTLVSTVHDDDNHEDDMMSSSVST